MYSGNTELGGFLMLDFFFSEEAMMYMASALYDSKDEELFDYFDISLYRLCRDSVIDVSLYF